MFEVADIHFALKQYTINNSMIISGAVSDPTVRVLVYRVELANSSLFPLGADGHLAEFEAGTNKLVRILYSWDVFDNLRAVLTDTESKVLDEEFLLQFHPSRGHSARTPGKLIEAVGTMRSRLGESVWTQIARESDYVVLAHAFLNHLELIAMTYNGYSDVYVVIQ